MSILIAGLFLFFIIFFIVYKVYDRSLTLEPVFRR